MKIIGLLDNYGSSIHTGTPPLLLLTDVSLLKSGKPFFVPDDGHEYCAFPSIAIKISRLGKSIPARFAHRYYTEAAAALNIRDITLLENLKASSLPWTEAVAFDYSAPIGPFSPIGESLEDNIITFRHFDSLGQELSPPVTFDPACLRLGADRAIEALSQRFTLKDGDIIFLGYTPSCFAIAPRQTIEAFSRKGERMIAKIR